MLFADPRKNLGLFQESVCILTNQNTFGWCFLVKRLKSLYLKAYVIVTVRHIFLSLGQDKLLRNCASFFLVCPQVFNTLQISVCEWNVSQKLCYYDCLHLFHSMKCCILQPHNNDRENGVCWDYEVQDFDTGLFLRPACSQVQATKKNF